MVPKGMSPGSRIVEQKRTPPIGHQLWKVALRPGTNGQTSNPTSRKIFVYVSVFFWALRVGKSGLSLAWDEVTD